MPSCLTAPVLDERFPLPGAVPVAPLEVPERDRKSLLTALGRVPDPRDPRGVRYPIVGMLTVVVCAMLAGARSYAAIGEVVRGPGRRTGARCARCCPSTARRCAPPATGPTPCTCSPPW